MRNLIYNHPTLPVYKYQNKSRSFSLPRPTPGGSAICSAAEAAFSSAKGEGKSDQVAGAVAAKVFYTKVFSVFDGSINCGSSVEAVNGMADYFNELGKSVITTVRYDFFKSFQQLIPIFLRFAGKQQWLSLTQGLVEQAR